MSVKKLVAIALFSLTPLLIPLIAMQFTTEVNWTLMDFIVAWVLLFFTGLALSTIMQKVKSKEYRIAISVVLLISFLLIWSELAVGIFGTPFSGN